MSDQHDEVIEKTTEPEQNTEAIAEEFEPERAMHTIKTLRAEAKATAKALKEAQALLQQHEEAKLSEQEKIQRELDALRAERDAMAREAHVSKATTSIASAATTAGAIRPDAIAKLIDLGAFDGDNAGELVAQVKAEYPELFASRTGTADAGAGKGAPAKTDFSSILRQATGH
jgi:hypothetical protein